MTLGHITLSKGQGRVLMLAFPVLGTWEIPGAPGWGSPAYPSLCPSAIQATLSSHQTGCSGGQRQDHIGRKQSSESP